MTHDTNEVALWHILKAENTNNSDQVFALQFYIGFH